MSKAARIIEKADREGVAAKMGVNRKVSDKWLSGARLPSRKGNPKKLADALGLPVEEMMAELCRIHYTYQPRPYRRRKNI